MYRDNVITFEEIHVNRVGNPNPNPCVTDVQRRMLGFIEILITQKTFLFRFRKRSGEGSRPETSPVPCLQRCSLLLQHFVSTSGIGKVE